MNTLQNMYKLFHFNFSTLPGKITQNSRLLTPLHSVEPIVPDFHRNSFNVRCFFYLLKNSLSRLLAENLLHSHGFYQKCIFELNMVNFNMETIVKLS